MRRLRALISFVAISAAIALVASAPSARAELDQATTRKSMQAIFGEISQLIPLSVNDAEFRDPARASRIASALQKIENEARAVAGHAASTDHSAQYLASSLAREAGEARSRFKLGEVDGAQFFVQRLTDFCVACHSRLPSAGDSPLARDFANDRVLAAEPPERRAVLQIATRRFDDALTTLEGLFASPDRHPAELLEPLTRYLEVSVRVKNDVTRPQPVLARFAARPDLWGQLRGDVEMWQRALKDEGARRKTEGARSTPSLARARGWLDEAASVIRYPSDRRALALYMLASGELHQYLASHPDARGAEAAEAWYWLGLIESRGVADYWLSEADYYLETAIRMAPGEPPARQAFELLEEETLIGWSGSGGLHMPADVRRHLEDLRAIAYGLDR